MAVQALVTHLGTAEFWQDREGKIVLIYRDGDQNSPVRDLLAIAPSNCTKRESAVERLFKELVRQNPRLKGEQATSEDN